jgi:hypothetical protein
VGELSGDDAASPVLVDAHVIYTPISRCQVGPEELNAPALRRTRTGLPLETAVEREPARTGPARVQLAAEAGLQLFRFLASAGAEARTALRAAFPLSLPPDDGLDPVGRAQLGLLARRSFDGRALHDVVAAGGAHGIGLLDEGAGKAALDLWMTWYDGLISEPTGELVAWDGQRMAYRFRISAHPADQTEIVLEASEYDGGRLDWYDFDMRTAARGLGAPPDTERRALRAVPTRARYAGQGASRWWQIEDGGVFFGDINAAPEDLARVAVAAFGTVFGDHWFVLPCHLPTGVLARVESLTVLDVFGRSHGIRSCAELDGAGRTWRFFELSGDRSADAATLSGRRCPWLFLAPRLVGVSESDPVEDVLLLRDEAANLGWGAELRVESAAGRTIDRAAQARAGDSTDVTAAGNAWRYRLSTEVPSNLVPLVPVRSEASGSLYLQRGRIATSATDRAASFQGPVGRILEPQRALLIHDAEVPRAGARITRSWQFARTGDGAAFLWGGRRKMPSGDVRSPGLGFDLVSQKER